MRSDLTKSWKNHKERSLCLPSCWALSNFGTTPSPSIFFFFPLTLVLREAFHRFLSRQFCQENLLFYEIVLLWKSIPVDNPDRALKARSIISVVSASSCSFDLCFDCEQYLADNGVCQVDIPADIREKIVCNLSKDPVPPTLFDQAVDNLIQDMYFNSFSQFWMKEGQSCKSVGLRRESSVDTLRTATSINF